MATELTALGLTISTLQELVDELTAEMQAIYGADINVDPNSPDGQMINIFAQAAEDILEVLLDSYNTFSVQGAYGTTLDQRVALNGIARRQGTYTLTDVSVTTNQALTLTGQDALISDPTATVFTVQDDNGNQFQLIDTYVFASADTQSLAFKAVDIGAVETTPNTITNQSTTVLGVTAVNNPTPATSVGVNEETDAQLKIRQAASFSLASTGPADAVEAALQATADILDAYVLENFTNAEVNTIPAHSIWAIVLGGTDADIAQAIYSKKGIGCGLKGSQSYTIARPNGNGYVAKWDTAVAQPLYIEFSIQGRVAGTAFDADFLADALAEALNPYKLGQNPTIGDVISAMITISPTGYLTNVGVSTDGLTYFEVVTPTTAINYFTVDAANIDISV